MDDWDERDDAADVFNRIYQRAPPAVQALRSRTDPYTFVLPDMRDFFVRVRSEVRAPENMGQFGRRELRLSFGPPDLWNAIQHTLSERHYTELTDDWRRRNVRINENVATVTFSYIDEGDRIPPLPLALIEQLAHAALDQLYVFAHH